MWPSSFDALLILGQRTTHRALLRHIPRPAVCAGEKQRRRKHSRRDLDAHNKEEEDDLEDDKEDVEETIGDEEWRPTPAPGPAKKMGQLRVPSGIASASSSSPGKGAPAKRAAPLRGLPPRGKRRNSAAEISYNDSNPGGGGAGAGDSDPLLEDWIGPMQFKGSQAPAKKGMMQAAGRSQAAHSTPTPAQSPGAGAGAGLGRPSQEQTEQGPPQTQQQQPPAQQSEEQSDQQHPQQKQQQAEQRLQQLQRQKAQSAQQAQILLAQKLNRVHQSEHSRAAFGDCFPSQSSDPIAPPWADKASGAAPSPQAPQHQRKTARASQQDHCSSGLMLGVAVETEPQLAARGVHSTTGGGGSDGRQLRPQCKGPLTSFR